ncbi:MAG: RDD family protein [Cytophagales bacterium]|nr:RDD family protein [Cytophagales bacterium]
MEKVSINTTQNVQINYALAGLGDRIFAYLIDVLIMISVTVVLTIILGYSGAFDAQPFLVLLAFLPAFFYHLILEVAQNGQSVGKKVLDIKVVKIDGSQANFAGYLLRWLLWPIDTFFYGAIAILCITIGGKGQRLGDIAAGTTVIKLKKSGFLKRHTLNDLDENYAPVFPNASELSPEHVELIKKAINAKLNMLNNKPVEAIAAKTRDKLGIHTDLPDLKFLHTILKDYHHLMLSAR